ncbi:MAG: DEAD/DEAH box helicase [Rhodospirillales bacterium]|nr:DEAD/DEAH box helicase [Rhodospirillales bacterium]
MRLHTFEDIRRAISPSAMDKATRYQRRRQATITAMAEDGTSIEGRVQGSAPMAYRASIALVPAADGSVAIRGSCTCPVGYNCKHVAALLIESMARPGLTRAAAAPAQAPAAPPPVTLPNEATAWLADLDREMALCEDAYRPTVQQRLMYVLDAAPDRRGRVVVTLELASVRLRKDGSFSKRSYRFVIHTVNSPTPPKYLLGSDLAILKRIDLLPSLYGFGERVRYGLFGEPGAEMLERILRTGRCRWESATGPLMSQGEPRQARIGWTLTEKGTLAPTIAIDAGGIAVPCWPLWYVDPQAFTCGVLETDLPPRVAVALLRAPPLEPRHVPILREKLAERLGEHSELLPAEPAPAEQVPGPPVPVLQLKRRPMTESESWYWPGSERTDRQVAQLAFAYGPFVLDPGERRDQPLVARGERLYAIERDPAAEIGFRNRLHRDTGLVLRGSRSGSYLPPDARDDLVLAEDDDDDLAWARFMADAVPRLKSEGWRIEVEAGFGPALAEASGDIGAKISEGSGIDWFEFEVGVTVDGERLNLLPQLVSLLRQGDGAGAGSPRRDGQSLFVPLPDGRLLPVPYAKVAPILAAIEELFRVELAEGEPLGLGRARAGELAAAEAALSEAGITWSGGEALLALGRRLSEVGAISTLPAPAGFTADLRPYQLAGYSWLRFLAGAGLGGVLADDMGLGKTVQALALVLAERVESGADGPSLVVAPTSLMANWRLEARRFAPALKVLTLHGPERKAQFEAIDGHDLVLTTFALLPRDREVLVAQPWQVLIVDEAQNVKNPQTNAAKVLRQLQAKQRICLTGTPIENHLGELWALMDFLNPGLLGDRRQFARSFRGPIEKAGNADRREALVRRIRPFLLRRTKAQVAAELPAKTEIIEHVEMDPGQSAIYEAVRLAMHEKVREAIAAKGLERSRIIILDALLKLRQVCCDPRLVKLPSVKKAAAGSAKLHRLMEMLEELVDEGRRVLLFSQFTSMLALIEERLAAANIGFVKITGQVRDRAGAVERFQAGEVPLFLISLKAGGTGLNLTAADTVILYDPWWNPAVEAQAIDRSHRIGQDKPVFVHRLVTLGTIEEKMLELQRRKGALAAGLLDPEAGGALDITADDIERLLAEG